MRNALFFVPIVLQGPCESVGKEDQGMDMSKSPSGSEKEIPSKDEDSKQDSPSSAILSISGSSSSSKMEPDTGSTVPSMSYACGSICAVNTVECTSDKWKESTLENFSSALDSVKNKETYLNLFAPNEKRVFSAFERLSHNAKRLFVRLICDKNIWHRKKALELESGNEFSDAIPALEEENLIRTDYSIRSIGQLLKSLTADEIKRLCRSLKIKASGTKKSLIKAVLRKKVTRAREIRRRINHLLGDMLKLTDGPRRTMLNALILHSLPHALLLAMDGRSPVLYIMDLVTEKKLVYPEYVISSGVYTSREQLLRSVNAMKFNAKIRYSIQKKRKTDFFENFKQALKAFKDALKREKFREEDNDLPQVSRQFTAGSILADALLKSIQGMEMIERYSQAAIGYYTLLEQETYKSNERGLWYDKLAAAHINRLDVTRAIDVLIRALLDKSLDPVYRELFSNRALKVTQYQYTTEVMVNHFQILNSLVSNLKSHQTVIINARCVHGKIPGLKKMWYYLESDGGSDSSFSNLEQVVLHRYRRLGFDDGLASGDALSMSIFGVFFWDIIYSKEVQNAFLSPYQRAPLDLRTGDFYTRREFAIHKRLADMIERWTPKDMHDYVDAVWKAEGRQSLVSWEIFQGKKQFKQMIECIGLKVISTMCLYLCREYHIARLGFPSIVVWNINNKSAKFFKMKNPNWPVSPVEACWLSKLDDAKADVSLVHVEVAHPEESLLDSSSDDDSPSGKQPQFGEGSKS